MAAARSRARADDTKAKPRSDAYVGLLGLSLLALSAAMLFAFLNWNLISAQPKAVQVAPKGGGGVPTMPGAPGVNPPGAPGIPPGVPPGAPPGQPPGGNPPPQKK
jgi:hypothetical protein